MRPSKKCGAEPTCLTSFGVKREKAPHMEGWHVLLTNKLIGPYDRSRGGRAESEALITG